MENHPCSLSRRKFLAGMVAGAVSGGALRGQTPVSTEVVLATAKSEDPARSVRLAVEALGGISRFVKKGQKVMLLPNPQGRLTGASTRPELVEEIARMCLKAGAASVEICSVHHQSRWSGTGVDQAVVRAGASFWNPGLDDYRTVNVADPVVQKQLRVVSPVFERDVVINLPIAKHHGSTRFTGALKNLMGVNDGNGAWHRGTDFLVGSILDLAATIRPHLHLIDATEILAENGPFGPGKTLKPNQVIAALDPVAADSYACALLGMKPEQVSTVRRAAERGLGCMDLVQVSGSADSALRTYRGRKPS